MPVPARYREPARLTLGDFAKLLRVAEEHNISIAHLGKSLAKGYVVETASVLIKTLEKANVLHQD